MENHTILMQEIKIDVLCHLHKTAQQHDGKKELINKSLSYLNSTTLYFSHKAYLQIAGLAIDEYIAYRAHNEQPTIH